MVDHAPLADITGADLKKFLRPQGSGKAKGADGWSPRELDALPERWLDSLGRQMRNWEQAALWPEALRHANFSMRPKANVEIEARLRSIGLLPYVYRAWMAIRKHQQKD